jgi:peroxisomal 2,4-dienoyl-CoA reductase
LITGGGSGIGLEIATQFGLHGARVAIMGRNADKLKEAEKTLNLHGVLQVLTVSGDVRDQKSASNAIKAVVERFGSVDVLVNNAAGNFLCLTEDLSLNAFKSVVDIDLVGTFNMSKAALSALQASKNGPVIINITATLHYGATPYVVPASAAKAGVDALTRGLAIEWREHGIRVCGIAPGPIADTEAMKRLAPESARAKELLSVIGEKSDIAFAAVFLASAAAKFITGETLVVDGGCWMEKPTMVTKAFYEKNIKKTAKL